VLRDLAPLTPKPVSISARVSRGERAQLEVSEGKVLVCKAVCLSASLAVEGSVENSLLA